MSIEVHIKSCFITLEETMYLSQNIKIGARRLNENQATILLPSYPKIKTQINQFREEAKKFNNHIKSNNLLDNFERDEEFSNFDNVITILGGRGSGKTSVFLTLKKYYSSEYIKKNDIILPLIVPDNMGENSDTLGWIISYLGRYVEDLESKFRNKDNEEAAYYGRKQCIGNKDDTLKEKFKELRKTYEIRKEAYLNKVLKRDEGTREYIQDKAKITEADQLLIVDFKEFVNSLIATQKKVQPDIEPLILVFFDDVDISAHRCPEVLETIRNYLNHPNIVVFVSGDFKVFSEIVCLEFLRKESVSNKDYDQVFIPIYQVKDNNVNKYSALELRKDRSQEYLKKVLPPSFRFEMEKLSDKEKSNFFYEIENRDNYNNPTLSQLIQNIKHKDKEFIRELLGDEDDFFMSNQDIPCAIFKIFDNNPRGLINPYYYLYQKIFLDEEQIWDIKDVKQFLQIIINSSSSLQKYKEDLNDIFVINESNANSDNVLPLIYINYHMLLEKFLNEITKNKQNYLIIEEHTTLYILCFFFEKLIKFTNPNYSNFYQGDSLPVILNYQIKKLFPNINDNALLLKIYSVLSNRIPLNNINLFNNKNKESKKIEQFYFQSLNENRNNTLNDWKYSQNEVNHSLLIMLFQKIFQRDEEWVEHKIRFIRENGKSYYEVYFDIISSTEENELKLLTNKEVKLLLGSFSSEISNEQQMKEELFKQFEKLEENYQNSRSNSNQDMAMLIQLCANIEEFLREKNKLEAAIYSENEKITSLNNQIEVTQGELLNIKDQETLIKTRKRMLDRIKDLETFTKNELREEEWNLIKENFIIETESDEGGWLTSTNEPISKEPIAVFNPIEFSVEDESLIVDILKSFRRIGLFIKDKNNLQRDDIINFAKRYFKEDQESRILKSYLPLDIEGRKNEVNSLKKSVIASENQLTKYKADLSFIVMQLEYIYNRVGFKVDKASQITSVLKQKFKDYLLGSIYKQVRHAMEKEKKFINPETEALIEILKVYSESIVEAMNFIREASPKRRLTEEDEIALKKLREKGMGRRIDSLISIILREEITDLNINVIFKLIEELKVVIDSVAISPVYRRLVLENIDNLEKYKNQYNGEHDNREFRNIKQIVLESLQEIIKPYIYIKVLIETRRANEDTSSIYFRSLKEELIRFMKKEKKLNRETRFVRFLETILITN